MQSSLPRLNEWMEHYEIELVRLRKEKPELYIWPDSDLQRVVDTMRQSFAKGRGHYNKDSYAIRAVCKKLELPLTFTAIDNYIRTEK